MLFDTLGLNDTCSKVTKNPFIYKAFKPIVTLLPTIYINFKYLGNKIKKNKTLLIL